MSESGTAGFRCQNCGNWYSGEFGKYHLCGGASSAGSSLGSVTYVTVPTFEDRMIRVLERIADALEKGDE